VSEDDIFLSMGIYLKRGFLDYSLCEEIRGLMESHPSERAYVKSVEKGDFIDEKLRNVQIVQVPTDMARMIRDRLGEQIGRLEAYFGTPLPVQEKPQFLLYGPGGCYKAHRDVPTDAGELNQPIAKRRVSIVIFLNDRNGPVGYEGGDLLFFDLSPDPQWKDYAVPVDPETGLLVAFRSNTLHEVRPVIEGRRYTIATWIH
jgi:SM-20-related protein